MSPLAKDIAADHFAAMSELTARQRAAIAREAQAGRMGTFSGAPINARLEAVFEAEAMRRREPNA